MMFAKYRDIYDWAVETGLSIQPAKPGLLKRLAQAACPHMGQAKAGRQQTQQAKQALAPSSAALLPTGDERLPEAFLGDFEDISSTTASTQQQTIALSADQYFHRHAKGNGPQTENAETQLLETRFHETQFQATRLQGPDSLPTEFRPTQWHSMDDFKETQFRQTELHIESPALDRHSEHTIDESFMDEESTPAQAFPRHDEPGLDFESVIEENLKTESDRDEPSLLPEPEPDDGALSTPEKN